VAPRPAADKRRHGRVTGAPRSALELPRRVGEKGRVLVPLTTPIAPPAPPLAVTLRPRWLVVRFAAEHVVQSWAIVNGGFHRTREVAFHEVRDAELPRDVDPAALLRGRLAAAGVPDAVGLLTSRNVERYVQAISLDESVSAHVVATVGLGNALRAGDPPGHGPRAGTINLVCRVSRPLSMAAALEAASIVVEARTLAVREAGVASRRTGLPATGTGTDCVALAWPSRGAPEAYAGKHTALGHVIGDAVLQAVRQGTAAWLDEAARLGWGAPGPSAP
jgi:adenosylcobinamide amidohydrolase